VVLRLVQVSQKCETVRTDVYALFQSHFSKKGRETLILSATDGVCTILSDSARSPRSTFLTVFYVIRACFFVTSVTLTVGPLSLSRSAMTCENA